MTNASGLRQTRLHPEWLRAGVALAAGSVILALLLMPSVVFGVTTGFVRADSHGAEYKLGEVVKTTGTIGLYDPQTQQGESAVIDSVSYEVNGVQPINPVSLPVSADREETDLSSQINSGELTVAVSSVDVTWGLIALGYGYGYTGVSDLAEITYTIRHKLPVLLDPPPPALPGPFSAPSSPFPVPGGGGGGGGGPQNLQVDKDFGIPGVPGAPPGSPPLDLAFNASFSSLGILVDGSSPDVLIEVDPTSGFVFSFWDTGYEETTALAAGPSGDWWIVYKLSGDWFVENLITGGQAIEVRDGGQTPGGDIKSAFFDVNSNRLILSVFEDNPSKKIGIWEIDPFANGGQGAVVNTFKVPGAPTGGGYDGLEIIAPNYVGANGDQVAEFEPGTGFVIDSRGVDANDASGPVDLEIVGMAFDGGDKLFVANDEDSAIYSGSVFQAGSAASNTPKAVAHQQPDFGFILVEGSPDKVFYVKLRDGDPSDGTPFYDFAPPAGDVEALAVAETGGNLYLYAVDNGPSQKVLYRALLTGFGNSLAVGGWTSLATLPAFVGGIGGMTTGGTNIYAAEHGSDRIHVIDPATGSVQNTLQLFPDMNTWTPGGLGSLAFVSAAKNPQGTDLLIGGSGNEFYRIDPTPGPDGGKVLANDFTSGGNPPYTIEGLSADENGIILAADRDTVQVYRTVIPGTPPAEPTGIGSYTARFSVTVGNPGTQTATADFSLAKAADIDLAITSVDGTDVTGLSSIGVTNSSVTIGGTIGDPTVTQVGITADLAETTLVGQEQTDGTLSGPSTFDDDSETGALGATDRAQYTTDGYWHFTSEIQGTISGDDTVAYFGKDDATNPNYCNPNCNVPDFAQQSAAGDFKTPSITLGQEATLEFDTWFDTEPMPDFDRKMVQWCQAGGGCQTVAQIVDPFTVPLQDEDLNPATVPSGTVIDKPQFVPGDAQKLILIENSLYQGGEAKLSAVTLDLSPFSGETGYVQFRFDTIDPFGNELTGWLIDEIIVKGAGTVLLAPATVLDDLTWSLETTVQEGENKLKVSAARDAYQPFITDDAEVTVYLDTAEPVVGEIVIKDASVSPAAAIASGVTNSPQVTVDGSFTESTPQVLEVIVNSKTVLKKTSFISNTFTATATISEGTNTIKVLLKDQAGLCNTSPSTACTAAKVLAKDTKTVSLDQTAPAIDQGTPAYPVGYVSARGGKDDFIVFQLDATDTNGVKSVKAASPGSSTYDISFRNDIPNVVKNQWGVDKTWLLPFKPGSGVFPGTLSLSIIVEDNAGNTKTDTVDAEIAASLEGFVFNLLPGQNLLSLPIMPSKATTFSSTTLEAEIDDMVAEVLSPEDQAQATESILYYDATDTNADPADRWSIWTADTNDTDGLTKLRTGKGYLFKMRDGAFAAPTSLGPGLPSAPTPILFTYEGEFLLEGQAVPPAYTVEGTDGAWNMVGFHSQDPLLLPTYLQSLESPQRIWASVLEYRNFVDFPLQAEGSPEVVLGAFARLLADDNIKLGRGLWLFALDDGVIVP